MTRRRPAFGPRWGVGPVPTSLLLVVMVGLVAACGSAPIRTASPLVGESVPAVPQTAQQQGPSSQPSPGASPGWLGVGLRQRSVGAGVEVRRVMRGSPAAQAGLQPGDVIVAVDQRAVVDPVALGRRVASAGAGARLHLQVERAGVARLVGVRLVPNPGYEGQLRLGFVGAPAPELQDVEVAQGDVPLRLESLRGKVVVLEFWASWCVACRALMPTMNDWYERFVPRGAVVLSVTMDPVEKASSDAFQLGMRYPVLADPNGRTASVYQAFALPTVFVIDEAGIVRDLSVGYVPEELSRIEQRLEEWLRRTAPVSGGKKSAEAPASQL